MLQARSVSKFLNDKCAPLKKTIYARGVRVGDEDFRFLNIFFLALESFLFVNVKFEKKKKVICVCERLCRLTETVNETNPKLF